MAKTIGDVADLLFKELERLDAVVGDDLELEIERAKAVSSVANQCVATFKLSIDASRLRAELSGSAVGVDRRLSMLPGDSGA